MAANNLVNTKQDLIAALVQRELKENATLMSGVTDYSNLAVKGAKQVSIPKYSSFAVQDRTFGAAATPNAPLTDALDDIALDKNKIVLFSYDAADEIQSTTDYLATAIARAAASHGRQVNTDIITEWALTAGLNINGAVPADITIDNILDMREFLMENFARMETCRLYIAADQEKAMLKLAEFSRFDYRGGSQFAPVVTGQIGSVYGVPVVVNQQITAQQAFMADPEGCGVAFQRRPNVAEDDDLTYGTSGKLVAVDQLYGVGGLQLGEGSAAAGKSPLIAKLAD